MRKLSSNLKINPSHGGFIPSIEGMRAIAVLVVLFFHLDIKFFSGGYLGVDLFFVISGFIITRNILFDLNNENFSIKNFYIRRFRRLFPALAVTILITIIISLLIIPPEQLIKTSQSAISAIFSLANVNFWLEAGYFDASASTKPLLHTWSLSVEEQFYLFWPAALLLLKDVRKLLFFSFALLLLSLTASYIFRASDPDAVFYLLPFRVHQLMAGALVAISLLHLKGWRGNVFAIISVVGFLCLATFFAESKSPLFSAFFVTCSGFLLLVCRDSSFSNMFFGNKCMLWVGKRSYAIYLVHWPVIVLYKYFIGFDLVLLEQILLLVATFVLAVILHEMVEKPFRKTGIDSTMIQRSATQIAVVMVMAVLSIASFNLLNNGLPQRFRASVQEVAGSKSDEQQKVYIANRSGVRGNTQSICNLGKGSSFSDYDIEGCINIDQKKKNILIIGDSLAADIYIMMNETYPDINFSQATAAGCTAYVVPNKVLYPACEELNDYRFAAFIEKDFDLIVVASNWQSNSISPLKKTVDHIQAKGKKVLVIGPRALFPEDVPLLMLKYNSLSEANRDIGKKIEVNVKLLEELREAMPDTKIIDFASIQCEPYCDSIKDGNLLYSDRLHLTMWGTREMGERFKKVIDLAE
jgi:peptidoglycan/LPS O-acetylase OafA/YrhL